MCSAPAAVAEAGQAAGDAVQRLHTMGTAGRGRTQAASAAPAERRKKKKLLHHPAQLVQSISCECSKNVRSGEQSKKKLSEQDFWTVGV